jgi:hypothetical protein
VSGSTIEGAAQAALNGSSTHPRGVLAERIPCDNQRAAASGAQVSLDEVVAEVCANTVLAQPS